MPSLTKIKENKIIGLSLVIFFMKLKGFTNQEWYQYCVEMNVPNEKQMDMWWALRLYPEEKSFDEWLEYAKYKNII